MSGHFLALWLALYSAVGLHRVVAVPDSTRLSEWAYDILNIPSLTLKGDKTILIAVVDDGFLLEHNSLEGFIYTNENEIAGNLIDDDQNGYIDDVQGWDIADHDNNVDILPHQRVTNYHGTYIASLISGVLTRCFGKEAKKHVRILPVKVLSDRAETTAILDGYRGIEYARKMGADIICTAWSGGAPTAESIDIISNALQEDILLVGSAGNTNQEQVDFPASTTGVLAIAALDSSMHRQGKSNYGENIDLSLPGEHVKGAHPDAVNAWIYSGRTSSAAGLAAGCAALLYALQPHSPSAEIIEALKNTAEPVDRLNLRHCGKLGAGLPNLELAAEYLLNEKDRSGYFNSRRPEGWLYINSDATEKSWTIEPYGAYESVNVSAEYYRPKDGDKVIYFYAGDSMITKAPISTMANSISIAGSKTTLRIANDKRRHRPDLLKLNYHMETIDSAALYCRGEVQIEASQGIITDNSGPHNYANDCACLWRIYAPQSEKIHLSFTKFNTEAKVDFVWLFDGIETHPNNIIAKFSGPELPPEVTSRTNRVTVWFVTDNQNVADGWELHFEGQ